MTHPLDRAVSRNRPLEDVERTDRRVAFSALVLSACAVLFAGLVLVAAVLRALGWRIG